MLVCALYGPRSAARLAERPDHRAWLAVGPDHRQGRGSTGWSAAANLILPRQLDETPPFSLGARHGQTVLAPFQILPLYSKTLRRWTWAARGGEWTWALLFFFFFFFWEPRGSPSEDPGLAACRRPASSPARWMVFFRCVGELQWCPMARGGPRPQPDDRQARAGGNEFFQQKRMAIARDRRRLV